jgi:3-oxoacyl-[acyl-carrier-protein] synthase-3
MSSAVDYSDRATCPIFGDGAAAVLVEGTTEEYGWLDSHLRTDGLGLPYLCMKAGGSVCPPSHYTIEHRMHFVHQEGKTVFKFAVTNMTDACTKIAERNNLTKENIAWVLPHQANVRIIEAVSARLEVAPEKVMMNIQKYGNTSAASLPLALWDYEKQLKKGDNLVLTAFGAGFTWGAAYLKWGYDGK